MEHNVLTNKLLANKSIFQTVEESSRIHKKRRKSTQLRFNLLDFLTTKTKQGKKTSKNRRLSVGTKKHSSLISKTYRKRKKPYSKLRKKILENRKNKQKASEIDPETTNQLAQKIMSLQIADNSQVVVHSRRFRSYCDNTTSPLLLDLTEKLLREIFRFQARAYEKNEIKGRAHRRYVLGFKECDRQMLIKKVKLVIMAPDCEPCSIQDGLDDIVSDMKRKCQETNTPYVFSLGRKKLGYVMFKRAPISCVAVLNYEGAQNVFQELLKCLETERIKYKDIMQPS